MQDRPGLTQLAMERISAGTNPGKGANTYASASSPSCKAGHTYIPTGEVRDRRTSPFLSRFIG